MQEKPDVLVLPETWNTGFFPAQDLANLADDDGRRVKAELGALAGELGVNLVAGSVANRRGSRVYNTSYIFDRQGCCIASYDKTHLFTPMHEDAAFACGNRLCSFPLDGVSCGIITCYDIRFPELTRSLALRGLDVLFVVAQWPDVRIGHLNCLAQARAIENQMFVAVCNSCGAAGESASMAVIPPSSTRGARSSAAQAAGRRPSAQPVILPSCRISVTVLMCSGTENRSCIKYNFQKMIEMR